MDLALPKPLSRLRRLATGLLLLGGLTPATAHPQEWHELYADGQRALRNGQSERAAVLLRRAIQKRPQPGVSVPTYGTNFEPQYFPYLRLAEAYLRLGAYDEALKTLETSARIGTEPAAERTGLEGRVRAALDANRPPKPTVVPSPNPEPLPPAAPLESLRVVEAPARDTAKGPSPSTATPPPPPSAIPARSPPRETTTLEVVSDPKGAHVFVDDEPIGRTDPATGRLRLTTLRPGRHRVRLAADRYADLVREVDLSDRPVTVHGVLAPLEPRTVVPPSVVAEPSSRLTLWLGLALLAFAIVVPLFWLKRSPSSAHQTRPATALTSTASAVAGSSHENLPMEFGEYRLIRRIGKGGMAIVYEADRRGERFALKRPLAGFLDDARFLERFLREAELGRTLHHPNIIRIFDRGQVGSIPYFTMELIDGETLRERLDREGRLDPTLATTVTARVAEALDYAHHKGVIHRDLKPSNIMLDRSGGVKVMDYGIARAQFLDGVTTTGGFLGTPHYAAPEAADALTEPKSDLYSLGVVFFEMLTGRLPFGGDSPIAILQKHIVTPPPAPSSINYALPKELDRIVLGLLSKPPADRPTAETLLNQLTDFLEKDR